MVKVTGFQKVDFTPRDSNNPIKGISLYVSYPKDGVTGEVAEKVFVSDTKLGTYLPKLGDHLNIFYNRYGKVDSVELSKM